ncbi:GTP cyclohydrolase I FolE [Rummeliibacillus sp. G93]|uniref:GTP cyclohydrolase I FolE n=1 Tax=Rummeliibacillus TaxID=648802 RepID=UPI001169FD4B|nr:MULTISPECIES: GTP cyclohydrolase I FolE [Rummeliibacillus]MBB5169725.1 GTP cyclohydrolase I [Rummeliibacillus stabekisii]UQW98528.1 GTP cyclohydrolase I FolE [Rummeliibacillus sp. G93]GEL03982.1 GTP cyclohydrolase 1 [Rummeliibacillus stabekisii]
MINIKEEKIDHSNSNVDLNKIEQAVKMILEAVGENPDREGLLDTPKRVAKMYAEMFQGLHIDAREYFKTVFHEEHNEVVLVKDIPFYSMCEHHLVPFYGKAHIAYLPKDGVVAGLSKLARTVETISHRPQLQERITSEIAETMMEMLEPEGVYVVVEAEHMCMTMRGIKKPGAKTVTSSAKGIFSEDDVKRQEILSFIKMA